MMSLQTSTHSSQMKTVGPAISLRTSFWSLLQKEQRRTSFSPFFLTIMPPRRPSSHALPDHVVDDTVLFGLLGRHDVVPLRVVLDPLERLPGMLHEDLVEPFPHPDQLLRGDVDVGRLPGQSLHERLVDDDARVR